MERGFYFIFLALVCDQAGKLLMLATFCLVLACSQLLDIARWRRSLISIKNLRVHQFIVLFLLKLKDIDHFGQKCTTELNPKISELSGGQGMSQAPVRRPQVSGFWPCLSPITVLILPTLLCIKIPMSMGHVKGTLAIE